MGQVVETDVLAVETPSGERHIVDNVAVFCRENNVKKQMLIDVANMETNDSENNACMWQCAYVNKAPFFNEKGVDDPKGDFRLKCIPLHDSRILPSYPNDLVLFMREEQISMNRILQALQSHIGSRIVFGAGTAWKLELIHTSMLAKDRARSVLCMHKKTVPPFLRTSARV